MARSSWSIQNEFTSSFADFLFHFALFGHFLNLIVLLPVMIIIFVGTFCLFFLKKE